MSHELTLFLIGFCAGAAPLCIVLGAVIREASKRRDEA